MHRLSNPKHIDILKRGVIKWNSWRSDDHSVTPDLSGEDLSEWDLDSVDFSEADLSGADLSGASLLKVDLSGADPDPNTGNA